jgi:hypothetical protein
MEPGGTGLFRGQERMHTTSTKVTHDAVSGEMALRRLLLCCADREGLACSVTGQRMTNHIGDL